MCALATQLWFIAFAFASRLDAVTGQIPGRARLARRFPDEVCEIWDLGSWDAEAGSEVSKKRILSFAQVLARPSMTPRA